jgi:hypothetical protein
MAKPAMATAKSTASIAIFMAFSNRNGGLLRFSAIATASAMTKGGRSFAAGLRFGCLGQNGAGRAS